MMSHLVMVADRVLNRPLMILPDKLALIASILDGRIGLDAADLGENLDMSRLQGPDASRFVGSSIGADGRGKVYRVDKGTAIVPVLGSLVNRGAWIGAKSGMTSYEGLAYQLDQAATDPDVERVVLDVDSPGGEAVGAFEVADKVAALAKKKEVVAVVNGMAASAAYAIASQATKIVTAPSGISGSIGVVMMHADYSGHLEKRGIKPTLIFAGAHKVDGHPYGPLPDNVKADLVAEIDQFYSLFVASVARGRKGMTEKSVRATEARTYIGQAAVDAGIADAVGSFETVLADFSKRGPRSVRSTGGDLLLAAPAPASTAAAVEAIRTEVDKLAIVEAGAKLGLQRMAAILADLSPTACSQQAALEALRIAGRETAAKADPGTRLHPTLGLVLEDRYLFAGGPLFKPGISPTADADGWGAVIAQTNREMKS